MDNRLSLSLVALVFMIGAALAQTAVPVTVTEPTFTQVLWENIQGPLNAALTIIIGSAATWLAFQVNTFFNVTNEAQRKANEVVIRNVLHEAVWSAAKYASQKTGVTLEELQAPGMPSKAFIDTAIDYVRTKNPDTAAAAGLSPGPAGDKGLAEIIISKIPDLIKILGGDKTNVNT